MSPKTPRSGVVGLVEAELGVEAGAGVGLVGLLEELEVGRPEFPGLQVPLVSGIHGHRHDT